MATPDEFGSDKVVLYGPDGQPLDVEALLNGGWRLAPKTVTFTGGAGAGQSGSPIPIFNVTGDVELFAYYEKIVTTPVGAGTLETGVAGATDILSGQAADATALTQGNWRTGSNNVGPAGYNYINESPGPLPISSDIIATVTTTNITTGRIDHYCWWRPLSPGATLVAA